MIGTKLAHFAITAHLGSGGMGDVYQATDSKLGRSVAIKLLPEAFTHDTERAARFEREARVLASLNHPNIAAIYGIEQSGERKFLVMELAGGETLAERIKRGPVPVDESLGIAKQICEALEAAHEKGIIHRDLKPANVKITPEGKVKVLDFGLAKAYEAQTPGVNLSQSPTISVAATNAGVILGTVAYMSPEQAKGRTVDKRADIWALGCVLYELLTGKQAFGGDSVSEIIASLLKSEPDWTALPEATPPNIRSLLRRCLQKDAMRRSRDASEIQLQIEEALSASALEMPAVAKASAPRPLWRRAMPSVLAVLATAAIAAGITIWNRPPTPASQPVSRFAVTLPPEDRLQVQLGPSVAISPDGSHVVYAGAGRGGQLYLRNLDNPEVHPIPGTQGGDGPFFSPDGQWLGFFVPGKLMKVAVSGGPALTLCDVPEGQYIYSAAWGPDGTIVFSGSVAGLFRVPAAGGMPTELTRLDSAKSETGHAWPEFLPGGKSLLFTIQRDNDLVNAQIAALNLESGEKRVLVEGGTYPRYAPTGHLVYHRAGTVMGVPFDPARLQVTGTPAPVLQGVMSTLTVATWSAGSGASQFAFSRTGTFAYVAGGLGAERTLAWVDRKGAVEPLGAPARAYLRPTLSPDGRQIALNIQGQGQTSDIWVLDIARGTLTRLTFEGNNTRPVWTPDGKRIAFPSRRGGSLGLFWKPADGTGAEEQLINDKLFAGVTAISPDGRLAFGTLNPTGENDIGIFELQGERKISVFLKTPFDEGVAAISPDGRWVAYLSLESGRSEIYVRPFPGPGGKWQISTEGGIAPVWARNGRELFYATNPSGKLMAVDITTQPTFQAGTPHVVLNEGFQLAAGLQGANYDISPDGERFLMVQGSEANLSQLNVVLNWFEELKQRVPVH